MLESGMSLWIFNFMLDTENEVNTFKKHHTFEVTDLEEAKQHLTRHGVISEVEIQD